MRETHSGLLERAQHEHSLQEHILHTYRTLFVALSSGFLAIAATLLANGFPAEAASAVMQPRTSALLALAICFSILGVATALIWAWACRDRAAQTHYWRAQILRIERGDFVDRNLLGQFLQIRHRRQKMECLYGEELNRIGIDPERHTRMTARRLFNVLLPWAFGILFMAVLLCSCLKLSYLV